MRGLQGINANTADAHHSYAFTGLHLADTQDCAEAGDDTATEQGGCIEIHLIRNGNALAFMDQHFFGKGAGIHQRGDSMAVVIGEQARADDGRAFTDRLKLTPA